MVAAAECYQKTVDDRTIILNTRGWYNHSFIAVGWTDLRLGFFLSLTDPVADDTTTGLSETIANPGTLDYFDRYWIGALDTVGGTSFAGFTNLGASLPDVSGDSTLVSSDAGVGTSTTNFWRPGNSADDTWSAAIVQGGVKQTVPVDNLQQHFPQDPVGAGGYAVLLALQLMRDNPASRTITMRIPSSPKSADWFYSDTPTKELIELNLQDWPPSVQLGPVTVAQVPNAFYFYWPFQNSRLRVHSLALLRAA
jgi:hypothetical protein